MSTQKQPAHVQSMAWYRNLAQLFVMDRITTRATSLTKQTNDRSEDISNIVLSTIENKLKGVK